MGKWGCSSGSLPLNHKSRQMFTSPPSRPDQCLLPWQRVMLCLVCLGLLGLLLAAAWVTPDPEGFGTHQQFGLPPCSFRVMFGIPCPSCGGTTSFAHFVRGQWGNAWRVNAAAFCGALLSTLFVPWGLWCSYRGRMSVIRSPLKWILCLLVTLTLLALAQWGFRVTSPTSSIPNSSLPSRSFVSGGVFAKRLLLADLGRIPQATRETGAGPTPCMHLQPVDPTARVVRPTWDFHAGKIFILRLTCSTAPFLQ